MREPRIDTLCLSSLAARPNFFRMSPVERLAGRYTLGQFVGAGAVGEVYAAWDEREARQVAVKRLRQDLLREVARAEPSLLERFAREGALLRAAAHPNIVTVLDVLADEPSGPAIVMEYVPGGGLNAVLEREPRLPLPRVLSLALDLSDALARAHRLGIVHRDLKPANVLIAENGTPRLTDFGVAHVVGANSLTGTGAVLGTLAYLSPEAWDGAAPDARTDIWAFGVMLYEMLAGRRPFDGRFPGLLHAAIATRDPQPLDTIREDVPAALADAIKAMLVKDPVRRMASVRELSVVVERLMRIHALGQTLPAAWTADWSANARHPARTSLPLLTTSRPELRLTTFSRFGLACCDRPVDWTGAQMSCLAALAVLARAGEQGVSIDRLATLVCPSPDAESRRDEIRQILDALRAHLGTPEAITESDEVRLDPSIVPSDVVDFETARAEGQVERARALYVGQFLDGFHFPGAPDFKRWLDGERRTLAQSYTDVLLTAAGRATARGDRAAAVDAWRALAATDPLNSRWASGLMTALADAGEVSAALQHARMYEILAATGMAEPSDREVLALGERLAAGVEREPEPVAAVAALAEALPPTGTTLGPSSQNAAAMAVGSPSTYRVRRRVWFVAALVVGVVVLVAQLGRSRRSALATQTGRPSAPVIAVGRIADYRGAQSGFAGAIGDLLATNLARAEGVRVVSALRMHEIAGRLAATDSARAGDATFAAAARQAGATELVDGMLFPLANGALRLDLRRVDLTSGRIRAAESVSGADLFAVVDSGTARLLGTLGADPPRSAVASVTTHSTSAYRLYAEGLQLYVRGDMHGANQLFRQAVREDSSFAMAAYYLAISTSEGNNVERVRLLDRALGLSDKATDRERLIIRGGWAYVSSSPTLAAVGETLATRYPDETDGHLYMGLARLWGGDFLGSIPSFERIIARDSMSLSSLGNREGAPVPAPSAPCAACVALRGVVTAYQYADSLPAAERAARRWIRLQPDAAPPWLALAWVLMEQDRIDEAQRANRMRVERGGGDLPGATFLAETRIWSGDFDGAERQLEERLDAGGDAQELTFFLAIAYLQEGRLGKALEAARVHRRLTPVPPGGARVPQEANTEAFVLFQMQRYRDAAALFDSVARWQPPGLAPSWYGRNRAWNLTHEAMALAAAGDTAALIPLIDSVRVYGALSFLARDQQLHHHVRALLLLARHDDDGAIRELRAARTSPTLGYSRVPYVLANVLLRRGRADEAVRVLQPALRGSLQSSNFYVTRTELHELLAQAWDASRMPGARDSAVAHWRAVAHAWSRADAPFRARGAAAKAALSEAR
jgi:serine/threonine protein kinase/DNA-binding SARP family transcriptional activator/tetratricopeptide (TPR) repeat protein